MKGALASLARRRAISVLPTPVGPIIRMFLGAISSAISGGSCWRRQRLRSAIATARLAILWPTTYLSSSATICRGVILSSEGTLWTSPESWMDIESEFLKGQAVVGEDADLVRDLHRLPRDLGGGERRVAHQRP